jgi:hypothetical protein
MENIKPMKKITKKKIIVLLFSVVITAFPFVSLAEDVKPDAIPNGEVTVSAVSSYIWRGQELSRNSIVIQPSTTISYKGLSFNVWGNLDIKPYSSADSSYSSNYTETDITLSYAKKLGIMQLGGGYIYYALNAPYSGAADLLDSQELFLTVGLDTLLSPTLTFYKEIDHYNQWYFLLGISHRFALYKKVGLKLAATASYLKSEDAGTYPKYDSDSIATKEKYDNFHDGTVSASILVALTKSFTVTPMVSYIFPLCDDAKYEMKGRGLKGVITLPERDSSFFYGGITISFIF